MDIRRSDLKMYARRALKGNWGTAVGALLIVAGISCLFVFGMEAILFRLPGNGFYIMPGMRPHYRAGAALRNIFLSPSFRILIAALVLLYLVYAVFLLLLGAGYQRILLDIASGRKAGIASLFWAFTHKPWKFILIALALALLEGITLLPALVLIFAAAITGESSFAVLFLVLYCVILFFVYAYAVLTFSQFYLILIEDAEKGIFEALGESRRLMQGNRLRFLVLCLSFLGILLLGSLSYGLALLWIAPYMGCTLVLFYLGLKRRTS